MITLHGTWNWWTLESTDHSQKVRFEIEAYDSERDIMGAFGGTLELDNVILENGKYDAAQYAVTRFFDKMRKDHEFTNMTPFTVVSQIAASASAMFYSTLAAQNQEDEILLKPQEWLEKEKYDNTILMDPDGWDRQNFDVDWNIPISESDMDKKMCMSTLMIRRK